MELETTKIALQKIVKPSKILVLDEVTSTMDEVKAFAKNPETGFLGVVVALKQSAGRGRQGREWISKKGDGVYLSVLYRIKELQSSSLGVLPLLVGYELLEKLLAYSSLIKLKWPNDLMVEDTTGTKKLGGLLLEAAHESNSVDIVIGVGINLRKSTLMTASSLEEISSVPPSFDKLSALILESILISLENFQSIPKEFIESYNKNLLFLHAQVSYLDNSGNKHLGINRGIAPDGSLVLETDSGLIKLYSGEVHQII